MPLFSLSSHFHINTKNYCVCAFSVKTKLPDVQCRCWCSVYVSFSLVFFFFINELLLFFRRSLMMFFNRIIFYRHKQKYYAFFLLDFQRNKKTEKKRTHTRFKLHVRNNNNNKKKRGTDINIDEFSKYSMGIVFMRRLDSQYLCIHSYKYTHIYVF